MFNYDTIRTLARQMKVHTADLLGLASANDPFYCEVSARKAAAEWLVNVLDKVEITGQFHVRRLHYKIISQPQPILKPNGDAYTNTHNDWGFLIGACRDARYLDLIDRSRVVDNRNPAAIINATTPGSQHPYIEVDDGGLYQLELPQTLEVPELLLRDFNVRQPYLVEIWTEKSGQNDVLGPLARLWKVNLINFDGESSEIGCRDSINRALSDGRPMRILYLSDFDPAGRSMPVAASRKMEFWLRNNHPELDITVDPIALLPEQAEEYNLPRTPIKPGEKRAVEFERRFGRGATEIDALEAIRPGELRKIVEVGLKRYIDPTLDSRRNEASSKIHALIQEAEDFAEGLYEDEIDSVHEEYEQLREQLNCLSERASGLWERYAQTLKEHAPHVERSDIPEPELPNEQFTPLFNSRRDYLMQLDWYREWQGQ